MTIVLPVFLSIIIGVLAIAMPALVAVLGSLLADRGTGYLQVFGLAVAWVVAVGINVAFWFSVPWASIDINGAGVGLVWVVILTSVGNILATIWSARELALSDLGATYRSYRRA